MPLDVITSYPVTGTQLTKIEDPTVRENSVVVCPGTTSVWVTCMLLSLIIYDYSGSWLIEHFI